MSDSEDETATANSSQVKVVLVGDGSAGKTSLAKRCAEESFGKSYTQTLGVDFFLKRFEIADKGSRLVDVTMEVCDIGGQSLGSQMLSNYLRGAKVVLFVYDITSTSSFENLSDWLSAVKKSLAEAPGFVEGKFPHMALVGNKFDLVHMRRVTENQAKPFATKHEMLSFLVSAKTGENVELVFKQMVSMALNIRLTRREAEATRQPLAAAIPAPAALKPAPSAPSRKQGHRSALCSVQ